MRKTATSPQILLDALRLNQTAAQWLSCFEPDPGRWDTLAVQAIVLGLAPQLHHRLAQWNLAAEPRAAAKLAVAHRAQVQRNQAIYQQLGEVLGGCAEMGLRPIALKGVHLAEYYYPEPAMRPMNDIDLLFEPEEMEAVEKLLRELGYQVKHKAAEMGAGVTKHTRTFRRQSTDQKTPNPYLSTDSDRIIEPHVSLEESWFGLKVDITLGVRQRAEAAVLSGHNCRVLAKEDLLLHLCVHYCFHLIQGAPALVQLVDLLAVTSGGEVDWDAFASRAINRDAAAFALAALTHTSNLLEAPVPASVTAKLAGITPPGLRRRVTQMDLRDILRRTQQRPLTNLWQRVQRGFSDRAETARWASDWQGRWRVWRTMLDVRRTDTGQIILQRFSR